MDYEAEDKGALHQALLNLHTCPRCRRDLLPVAFAADVWGCRDCKETWHVPPPPNRPLTAKEARRMFEAIDEARANEAWRAYQQGKK